MLKKIFFQVFKHYPHLFLIDAVISIVSVTLLYYFPKMFFYTVHEKISYIVMFMAIPFLFSLFIVESKHKKKYLGIVGFNLFYVTAILGVVVHLVSQTSLFEIFTMEVDPHEIYSKNPSYFFLDLSISFIQAIIGLLILKFHSEEEFKIKENRPRWVLALFSTFFMISYYMFTWIISLPLILVAGTGNFLGLKGSDVISIERIYEKDGRVLHLIPMIHVGDESFYKEISQVDAKTKTLFLLEGVKDEKKLLQNIDYTKFAEKVGLDLQAEHFKPNAPLDLKNNVTIIPADVDVNQFSPKTRKFLKEAFEKVNKQSIFEILSGDGQKFTRDEMADLVVDIVHKRNDRVLSELKKHEKDYKEIIIPWGAAHMPEIERKILASGYKLISTKERVVIPLNKVFEKISKAQK